MVAKLARSSNIRPIVFFLIVTLLLMIFVRGAVAQGGLMDQAVISPPLMATTTGMDSAIPFYSRPTCDLGEGGERRIAVGAPISVSDRGRVCDDVWYAVEDAEGRTGWLSARLIDFGWPKPVLEGCRFSGGDGGKPAPFRDPRKDDDNIFVMWERSEFRPHDLVHYVVWVDGVYYPSEFFDAPRGPFIVDLQETVLHDEPGQWIAWFFGNDLYVAGCAFEVKAPR